MPKLLIEIGAMLVLAAGIVYFIQRWMATQQVTTQSTGSNRQTSVPHIGYRQGEDKRFTRRMPTLPANALLTLRTPDSGRSVKLQVISPEKIVCMGDGLVPNGVTWRAVYCASEPNWTDADVLLLQTDEFGYVLRRRRVGPEVCKQFQPTAKAFANRPGGQLAGSHALGHAGDSYTIQDVGFWSVTSELSETHIPSNVPCRWIIAHAKNSSEAIVVEDGKGNFDSVWEGWVVNLDRVITDVLTNEG